MWDHSTNTTIIPSRIIRTAHPYNMRLWQSNLYQLNTEMIYFIMNFLFIILLSAINSQLDKLNQNRNPVTDRPNSVKQAWKEKYALPSPIQNPTLTSNYYQYHTIPYTILSDHIGPNKKLRIDLFILYDGNKMIAPSLIY